MTITRPEVDSTQVDRDFAPAWYQKWIDAWNLNQPETCHDILTEDFVLDSPTTRHTGLKVQGPEAAADYIRYILRAYPDLKWEVTAPPCTPMTSRASHTRGVGPGISTAGSIPRESTGTASRSSSPVLRCSTSGATGPATSMPPTTSLA